MVNKFFTLFSFLVIITISFNVASVGAQTTENPWPMVGANSQRTSWSPEEVQGELKPIWYRSLDPYVPRKFQLIIANDTIYVSSAKGLYAMSTTDGSQKWVYATSMPLGNSPTLANGYLYVGGYDGKIYAIDANTGTLKPGWSFIQADAGYETNPVVEGGVVYAGNRDGNFYALDANTGLLKWKFPTGGPILFSAAFKNNVLYFASNDSYAYAVNTAGTQVWKSAKLPGAGFHSWWPVIYTDSYTDPAHPTDYVIFPGSTNYRMTQPGWEGGIGYPNFVTTQETYDLFPGHATDPNPTFIGPIGNETYTWAAGTLTMDNSRTAAYYRDYPHRRTDFMLRASNGTEYTWPDATGKPQYLPFSWAGVTHSGNRYPPLVGKDNVLYSATLDKSDPYIGKDQVVGWKFGTPFISLPMSTTEAMDEPHVWSSGGNVIYVNLCCDRQILSFDISKPNTSFPNLTNGREWVWTSWNLWPSPPITPIMPNYNIKYWGNNGAARFGSVDGVYGDHGVQSPPIPYKGKVYVQLGNSVTAWGVTSSAAVQYPILASPNTAPPQKVLSTDQLKSLLLGEINKMLNAGGLLRSGYHHVGIYDGFANNLLGPNISDYFHNPSDTVITLLRALPYLPAATQTQVQDYIKRWQCVFPMQTIGHIGWKSASYNVTCDGVNYTGQYGIKREAFDTPPEIAAQMVNWGPLTSEDPVGWNNLPYWRYPPLAFYGMWKYSVQFGNAKANFDAIKPKWAVNTIPTDTTLSTYPHILNAYIGGAYGYLQLEKLAGYTTDITQSSLYPTYDAFVKLRIATFTKVSPWTGQWDPIDKIYQPALNIARNYMYMVPELADIMRTNLLAKVQDQITEIDAIAPNWFVTKYDSTVYEGELQQLFDYNAVFQAKAKILNQNRDILTSYLDVPAFEKGDLFYIDDVISAIEANPSGSATPTTAPTAAQSPTPVLKPGDANGDGKVDGLDYVIWLNHYNQTLTGGYTVGDFDNNGKVDGLDYVIWLNNYGR